MVQVAKKDQSKHKQAVKKTGGGGPTSPIPSTSQQLIGIMGPDFMPFENKYDSNWAQHGDAVIFVDEQKNDGPETTPEKNKGEKIFFPRKES